MRKLMTIIILLTGLAGSAGVPAQTGNGDASDPVDSVLAEFSYEALHATEDASETGAGTAAVGADLDFLMEQVRSQQIIVISVCVLALASLAIGLLFLRNRGSAQDLVTITALNSLIFGTIILALVVQDVRQLTAAVGVIGAIAGYLFRGLAQQQEGAKERTDAVQPGAR